MRERLLLPLLLAACTADREPDPPFDPNFRVPSAKPQVLAGQQSWIELAAAMPSSCLTRYDYVEKPLTMQYYFDAECRRQLVEGDPRHVLETCTEGHYALAPRREVWRDEQGRVIRMLVDYTGGAHADFGAVYDEAGRLLELTEETDEDQEPEYRYTVDDFHGTGGPATASILMPAWVNSRDQSFPETTTATTTYAYDGGGRLVEEQERLGSGRLVATTTYVYRDAQHRRETVIESRLEFWEPTFDDDGPPARGYELFDDDGRIVEDGWSAPTDYERIRHYRYDEQGRLLTTVVSERDGQSYTAHEVYDCP